MAIAMEISNYEITDVTLTIFMSFPSKRFIGNSIRKYNRFRIVVYETFKSELHFDGSGIVERTVPFRNAV
jgi:hypothetical protein